MQLKQVQAQRQRRLQFQQLQMPVARVKYKRVMCQVCMLSIHKLLCDAVQSPLDLSLSRPFLQLFIIIFTGTADDEDLCVGGADATAQL